MTLGMMMVFAIALATVLILTQSNQHSTNLEKGKGKAFFLAESGLNNAFSTLANSQDPSVASAITPTTASVIGGTSAYSGTLSGTTWTLRGDGTAPNPNPAGGPVTRTVTQQVTVSVVGTPWEWATFVDQPSSCLTIRNNALVATALYVKGNLCMSNGSSYTASKLYVGGTLTNNGSIGTAGSPITSATIVGGCTGGSPNPHPCTASDKVYASSISQTAQPMAKPNIDLASAYSTAKPGPLAGCTTGTIPGGFDTDTTMNRSRAQFDLTPASSYNCVSTDASGNTVGQLSWNAATAVLTAAGVIFFDGDIWSSGGATYTGRATIYASGKVTFSNNATLCGIAGCTSGWDSSTNLILLAAGSTTDAYGVTLSNGANVQAAVYAITGVYVDNNASQWGPVIARDIYIDNNAGQSKPLVRLPPGAPGISEIVRPIQGSWRG